MSHRKCWLASGKLSRSPERGFGCLSRCCTCAIQNATSPGMSLGDWRSLDRSLRAEAVELLKRLDAVDGR